MNSTEETFEEYVLSRYGKMLNHIMTITRQCADLNLCTYGANEYIVSKTKASDILEEESFSDTGSS